MKSSTEEKENLDGGITHMVFIVYNCQGIPVQRTTDEIEAQVLAYMEDGYYTVKP